MNVKAIGGRRRSSWARTTTMTGVAATMGPAITKAVTLTMVGALMMMTRAAATAGAATKAKMSTGEAAAMMTGAGRS